MKAATGILVVLLLSGCSGSAIREPAPATTDAGSKIAILEESLALSKKEFSLSMCVGVWRSADKAQDVLVGIDPHRLLLCRAGVRDEYLIQEGKGPVAEHAGKEFKISFARKFDEMILEIGDESFFLKQISDQLPEEMKGRANQAPEPTPLRVTPAADAPVAPRSVAAHL
jgi:hypothetical protein